MDRAPRGEGFPVKRNTAPNSSPSPAPLPAQVRYPGSITWETGEDSKSSSPPPTSTDSPSGAQGPICVMSRQTPHLLSSTAPFVLSTSLMPTFLPVSAGTSFPSQSLAHTCTGLSPHPQLQVRDWGIHVPCRLKTLDHYRLLYRFLEMLLALRRHGPSLYCSHCFIPHASCTVRPSTNIC